MPAFSRYPPDLLAHSLFACHERRPTSSRAEAPESLQANLESISLT